MSTALVQRGKGYIAMGAVSLVLGVAYTGLALEMPLGSVQQPGAAVFPIIVGVILMIGSLAAIFEGRSMARDDTVELPAGADRIRVLYLVGLMLGYFVALPWLGQLLSSVFFSILLMRILSTLHWARLLIYALAMSLSVYLLFVYFLKVPMPAGILAF